MRYFRKRKCISRGSHGSTHVPVAQITSALKNEDEGNDFIVTVGGI